MIEAKSRTFPTSTSELHLAAMPSKRSGNSELLIPFIKNSEHSSEGRMKITGQLGKLVERGILKAASGEIKTFYPNNLRLMVEAFQDLASMQTESTLTSEKLAGVYTNLVFSTPVLWNVETGAFAHPVENPIHHIMELVDYHFNSKLYPTIRERYDQFSKVFHDKYSSDVEIIDGKFTQNPPTDFVLEVNERRYLVEAALMLAKSLYQPFTPLEHGKLIRDISFVSDGKAVAQFDGAIVRDGLFSPEARYITSNGKRRLSDNISWEAVEVKTKFGPSYTTGKNKLRSPRQADVRELKHKFGRLMLEWDLAEKPAFILPKVIHFVYPRGVLDTVYQSIQVNSEFIDNWIIDIHKFLIEGDLTEHKWNQLTRLNQILKQYRI